MKTITWAKRIISLALVAMMVMTTPLAAVAEAGTYAEEPAYRKVYVELYDEVNDKLVKGYFVNVETIWNEIDPIAIPDGYKKVSGSWNIVNYGYSHDNVYIGLAPIAEEKPSEPEKPAEEETRVVFVQFWDEVKNEQVKGIWYTIAKKWNEIDPIKAPEGYCITNTTWKIEDLADYEHDYVYVGIAPTYRQVWVEFYDVDKKEVVKGDFYNVEGVWKEIDPINPPAGYEIVDTTWKIQPVAGYDHGYVYIGVSTKKPVPTEKTVTVSYYKVENGTKFYFDATEQLTVAYEATTINTADLVKAPADYDIKASSVAIVDGKAEVEVVAKPTTKIVTVSYYEMNKNGFAVEFDFTEKLEVAIDATEISTATLTKIPANYEAKEASVKIENGKASVELVEIVKPTTKDITVRYYIYDNNNNKIYYSPVTVTVAIDATTVSTATLTAPDGYYFAEEIIDIVDGAAEVEVIIKPTTETITVTYFAMVEGNEMTFTATEEVVVAIGATTLDTSKLVNVPAEYEVKEATAAIANGKAKVEVVKIVYPTEKDVTVSFYTYDSNNNKTYFETTETVTVAIDATTVETATLTAPDGYFFAAEIIDIVDGKAEAEVFIPTVSRFLVSYYTYDEKGNKVDFDGTEWVSVAFGATEFDTSVLTQLPAGYVPADPVVAIDYEGITMVEVKKEILTATETVTINFNCDSKTVKTATIEKTHNIGEDIVVTAAEVEAAFKAAGLNDMYKLAAAQDLTVTDLNVNVTILLSNSVTLIFTVKNVPFATANLAVDSTKEYIYKTDAEKLVPENYKVAETEDRLWIEAGNIVYVECDPQLVPGDVKVNFFFGNETEAKGSTIATVWYPVNSTLDKAYLDADTAEAALKAAGLADKFNVVTKVNYGKFGDIAKNADGEFFCNVTISAANQITVLFNDKSGNATTNLRATVQLVKGATVLTAADLEGKLPANYELAGNKTEWDVPTDKKVTVDIQPLKVTAPVKLTFVYDKDKKELATVTTEVEYNFNDTAKPAKLLLKTVKALLAEFDTEEIYKLWSESDKDIDWTNTANVEGTATATLTAANPVTVEYKFNNASLDPKAEQTILCAADAKTVKYEQLKIPAQYEIATTQREWSIPNGTLTIPVKPLSDKITATVNFYTDSTDKPILNLKNQAVAYDVTKMNGDVALKTTAGAPAELLAGSELAGYYKLTSTTAQNLIYNAADGSYTVNIKVKVANPVAVYYKNDTYKLSERVEIKCLDGAKVVTLAEVKANMPKAVAEKYMLDGKTTEWTIKENQGVEYYANVYLEPITDKATVNVTFEYVNKESDVVETVKTVTEKFEYDLADTNKDKVVLTKETAKKLMADNELDKLYTMANDTDKPITWTDGVGAATVALNAKNEVQVSYFYGNTWVADEFFAFPIDKKVLNSDELTVPSPYKLATAQTMWDIAATKYYVIKVKPETKLVELTIKFIDKDGKLLDTVENESLAYNQTENVPTTITAEVAAKAIELSDVLKGGYYELLYNQHEDIKIDADGKYFVEISVTPVKEVKVCYDDVTLPQGSQLVAEEFVLFTADDKTFTDAKLKNVPENYNFVDEDKTWDVPDGNQMTIELTPVQDEATVYVTFYQVRNGEKQYFEQDGEIGSYTVKYNLTGTGKPENAIYLGQAEEAFAMTPMSMDTRWKLVNSEFDGNGVYTKNTITWDEDYKTGNVEVRIMPTNAVTVKFYYNGSTEIFDGEGNPIENPIRVELEKNREYLNLEDFEWAIPENYELTDKATEWQISSLSNSTAEFTLVSAKEDWELTVDFTFNGEYVGTGVTTYAADIIDTKLQEQIGQGYQGAALANAIENDIEMSMYKLPDTVKNADVTWDMEAKTGKATAEVVAANIITVVLKDEKGNIIAENQKKMNKVDDFVVAIADLTIPEGYTLADPEQTVVTAYENNGWVELKVVKTQSTWTATINFVYGEEKTVVGSGKFVRNFADVDTPDTWADEYWLKQALTDARANDAAMKKYALATSPNGIHVEWDAESKTATAEVEVVDANKLTLTLKYTEEGDTVTLDPITVYLDFDDETLDVGEFEVPNGYKLNEGEKTSWNIKDNKTPELLVAPDKHDAIVVVSFYRMDDEVKVDLGAGEVGIQNNTVANNMKWLTREQIYAALEEAGLRDKYYLSSGVTGLTITWADKANGTAETEVYAENELTVRVWDKTDSAAEQELRNFIVYNEKDDNDILVDDVLSYIPEGYQLANKDETLLPQDRNDDKVFYLNVVKTELSENVTVNFFMGETKFDYTQTVEVKYFELDTAKPEKIKDPVTDIVEEFKTSELYAKYTFAPGNTYAIDWTKATPEVNVELAYAKPVTVKFVNGNDKWAQVGELVVVPAVRDKDLTAADLTDYIPEGFELIAKDGTWSDTSVEVGVTPIPVKKTMELVFKYGETTFAGGTVVLTREMNDETFSLNYGTNKNVINNAYKEWEKSDLYKNGNVTFGTDTVTMEVKPWNLVTLNFVVREKDINNIIGSIAVKVMLKKGASVDYIVVRDALDANLTGYKLDPDTNTLQTQYTVGDLDMYNVFVHAE